MVIALLLPAMHAGNCTYVSRRNEWRLPLATHNPQWRVPEHFATLQPLSLPLHSAMLQPRALHLTAHAQLAIVVGASKATSAKGEALVGMATPAPRATSLSKAPVVVAPCMAST